MQNEDWEKAIQIASTFSRLGKHKDAIKRAQQALKNPRFAKQIGVDPEKATQEGIEALKERYAKYTDYEEYIEGVIEDKIRRAKKRYSMGK